MVLSDYKTEHEGSVQAQLEELAEILKQKDFQTMYYAIERIVDEIYQSVGADSAHLIKAFSYIGQNLLNIVEFEEFDNKNIRTLFPLNEALIPDRKYSELWLFRVMNYVFEKSSINRYPLLENVFDYIENHIKEDINLNQIVLNCAISQGYLSRIFKNQFQVSVMEYLHMRKIHLAKGYFYYTEDSIGEIAFRLGYNESSYFSKVFKKYEHVTGKEYRERIKNTEPVNTVSEAE
ncbi:MAG: AraC family transcriptional regulator [Hespellia sp.]|nr:AraC family transcriptional regulator [Hespellia sp.]